MKTTRPFVLLFLALIASTASISSSSFAAASFSSLSDLDNALIESFGMDDDDESLEDQAKANEREALIHRRTPNSITPFDKKPILVAEESSSSGASAESKAAVKYKDYEKFEFDSLDVSGDNSSEGQISITAREQKKFKNPLPKKKNFIRETRQGIANMK
ncbi:MAG: hypothetical protein HQK50_01505 [Oligoflexia bacterium]|nr:hypothetical protein [Oligoflexia bacterium]MBF0364213.1 hypothetical protein [Oligoflexia bacterium]